MRVQPRDLELWIDDANLRVGRWRDVMVQCRRGPLDPRVFAHAEEFMREGGRRGVVVGLVSVVEARAPMASQELRRAQREHLERWAEHGNVRMAVAILGDDVASALARSAGRLIGVASPYIQRFDDVPRAVSWLSQEMGTLTTTRSFRAADLLAVVEELRRPPTVSDRR